MITIWFTFCCCLLMHHLYWNWFIIIDCCWGNYGSCVVLYFDELVKILFKATSQITLLLWVLQDNLLMRFFFVWSRRFKSLLICPWRKCIIILYFLFQPFLERKYCLIIFKHIIYTFLELNQIFNNIFWALKLRDYFFFFQSRILEFLKIRCHIY